MGAADVQPPGCATLDLPSKGHTINCPPCPAPPCALPRCAAGYKSRLQVPDLVEMYQRGETMLDEYITHTMPFDGGWAGGRAGGVPGWGAWVGGWAGGVRPWAEPF